MAATVKSSSKPDHLPTVQGGVAPRNRIECRRAGILAFPVPVHPCPIAGQVAGNLPLAPFYWKLYFWNNAYALISVGGRPNIDTLLRYIENQDDPRKQGRPLD